MASVNNVPRDLQDAIREYLGRRTKLYIKRMVKQEVRPEKWENRVIALSGTRLYVFNAKPSKSPQEHNICYLDIQSIESQQQNKLIVTTNDGKSYSFITLETETDEINHMITHIGTSVKQIFPSFPLVRLIKKIDVTPPERLKMMNDMIKTIETKEHGPCGNFAMMYACMCDYFNQPYREEVAWDVDTLYLSQDCKVLTLKDFDHLSQRDLAPIVSALEHNTWFTGLDISGVKTSNEIMQEVLKVMQKNCLIEDVNLSNCQMSAEFLTRLGVAVLSNSGSQLSKIDLSKNCVDDKAMVSFIGSLKNLSRGVTHLNISSTRLGKGFRDVFKILSENEAIFGGIQVLNVSDNSPKEEDLANMYTFLAKLNGITHLDMSGIDCALDGLVAPLQRGCTSVTHLLLSRNVYTHQKKKEVTVQPSWKQFFASACTLEVLDLSYCKIPPEALKELLLGISSNVHLKNLELNISGNDFGVTGSLNIESTIADINNIASLDISNNNLEQGMATLLSWIKTNKTLKHLSIGRNFENLKQKQLPNVLDGLVQLIQDEDCGLESLSLADSKLNKHLSVVINAMGSNLSLTELDISGNQMGDFGARMLSKALQINNKLKTIYLDKNGITAPGFTDIADALEKNFSLKKLPAPVADLVLAQQKNPDKTEAAIQRIEAFLQRNHSPQKYLVNRDYKIQGCILSSTQQMVDRLVVQVQDTVNALQFTPSADEYKEDIDVANGFVKDANSSQLLLPHLQDIADKSVEDDSPVAKRLKELSSELRKVLDEQIKKTVEGMLECTTKQFTAITQDKEFTSDLTSGCYKKSALPDDFASHSLAVIEMDIFNKLSELNLAVAAHISDRAVDAVIENLSSSHKKLTNHLNMEKSKAGRQSKVVKEAEPHKSETEKVDRPKTGSVEDLASNHSSDSTHSSPMPLKQQKEGTPNIANKRETAKARRNRPPTVIDTDHVKKALEVYNSVNPTESAPRPCPGSRTNTPPSSSLVTMTARDADDFKLTELTEQKKVDQILDSQELPPLDLDVTTATVHVQPPTINISKSTVSGTSGKSVTLTCSVTSSETVKDVYWKKDGKAKINSSSNSKKYSGCSASTPSLTILNVEKNDAGSYICFAKNSGGQGESSTIKLDVSEPPKPKPSAAPLESLPDVKVDTLACAGKSRPRPPRNRRPGRPNPAALLDQDEESKEEEKKIDEFFTSIAVKVETPVKTTPSKLESKADKEKPEKDKDKKPMKPNIDGKNESGGKSRLFGKKDSNKDSSAKDQKEQKSKPFFKLPFGKKSKDTEKKDEVKVVNEERTESEAPPEKKESKDVPDKENTEPEVTREKEEPKEVKPEPEEEVKVEEPKKALRPPVGGMGFPGLGGDMLAQLRQKQQNRKSFGKSSEETQNKDKETSNKDKEIKDKEAQKPPKTETKSSPKPSETTNKTPDTKSEKSPKSVLQLVQENKPKPAPRPGNNRLSSGSRSSTTGEDGEVKAPKPAPKPRPNPPPKPRSSLTKSDALGTDKTDSGSEKRSSGELKEKSSSLPRNTPPITDKAEVSSSRPVSMFVKPNKDMRTAETVLPASKSSSDLRETGEPLLKDLKKIIEDEKDEKDDKEEVQTGESNGEKDEMGQLGTGESNKEKDDVIQNKTEDEQNGSGSGKDSTESVNEADSEDTDKTDFETDVIMV